MNIKIGGKWMFIHPKMEPRCHDDVHAHVQDFVAGPFPEASAATQATKTDVFSSREPRECAT